MAHRSDVAKGLTCSNGQAAVLHHTLHKATGDSRVVEVAHQTGPDLMKDGRHSSVPNTIKYFNLLWNLAV